VDANIFLSPESEEMDSLRKNPCIADLFQGIIKPLWDLWFFVFFDRSSSITGAQVLPQN
jgi:hypothetical protein